MNFFKKMFKKPDELKVNYDQIYALRMADMEKRAFESSETHEECIEIFESKMKEYKNNLMSWGEVIDHQTIAGQNEDVFFIKRGKENYFSLDGHHDPINSTYEQEKFIPVFYFNEVYEYIRQKRRDFENNAMFFPRVKHTYYEHAENSYLLYIFEKNRLDYLFSDNIIWFFTPHTNIMLEDKLLIGGKKYLVVNRNWFM